MELKTIELTKKFGGETAVNHLNVTMTNSVYGLLGANGAGKIVWDGKNIVGLNEKYRGLLGYLPQHFGYFPDFTALDFLECAFVI